MVVESWIMGKLLDFNHQSLTLRFMEAAKVDEMNSKAVDQTLTNSNRELLERWLIQIEKGRGKLVEILLRKLPLPMAERFLLQLENDRDDVVEAALAGGTIERYLDQMEAGNTEVKSYAQTNLHDLVNFAFLDSREDFTRLERARSTFSHPDGEETRRNDQQNFSFGRGLGRTLLVAVRTLRKQNHRQTDCANSKRRWSKIDGSKVSAKS